MSLVAGDDPPPAFVCPLTLEMMSDPVTAADGHSYEKKAIEHWLQSSRISPLTGGELSNGTTTSNHALRNAIEDYRAAKELDKVSKNMTSSKSRPFSKDGPKTILLGDSNVGKTSLVLRVKEGTFKQDSLQATIGCSFCEHEATLPHGGPLRLALWDTAGQEK